MNDKKPTKTDVIQMRIAKNKKVQFNQICETLKVSKSKLLDQHINNIISLYQ